MEFRNKSAKEKLRFLEISQRTARRRLISFLPFKITPNGDFSICVNNATDKKIVLVKFQIQFPSGRRENFEYTPDENEFAGKIISGGFAFAGKEVFNRTSRRKESSLFWKEST